MTSYSVPYYHMFVSMPVQVLVLESQVLDNNTVLIAQIQAGWPDNPARLPAELRQFATYSDEN